MLLLQDGTCSVERSMIKVTRSGYLLHLCAICDQKSKTEYHVKLKSSRNVPSSNTNYSQCCCAICFYMYFIIMYLYTKLLASFTYHIHMQLIWLVCQFLNTTHFSHVRPVKLAVPPNYTNWPSINFLATFFSHHSPEHQLSYRFCRLLLMLFSSAWALLLNPFYSDPSLTPTYMAFH